MAEDNEDKDNEGAQKVVAKAFYPRRGTLLATPGTLKIDTYYGEIIHPDNTKDELYPALQSLCVSVALYCDIGVRLSFRRSTIEIVGTMVSPTRFRESHMPPFDSLYVETDYPTFLWMEFASAYDAVSEVEAARFVPGVNYAPAQNIVSTGDSDPATAYSNADEHKLADQLNRRVTVGIITNKSSNTLFMWFSQDGSDYGTVGEDYIELPSGKYYNIEGRNIYSLKVGADANNTSYQLDLR